VNETFFDIDLGGDEEKNDNGRLVYPVPGDDDNDDDDGWK
jgi:hypothetical protein